MQRPAKIAPQLGRAAQRDEATKVVGGADAGKIVVLAEASVASALDKFLQHVELSALGGERVELTKTTDGPAAEKSIRQGASRPRGKQSIEKPYAIHQRHPIPGSESVCERPPCR